MSYKKYDRNLRLGKFYNTINTGSVSYNPQIIVYFGSDDNIVRIEETWRGQKYAQTISGSNFVQQWPNYDYYEVYSPWTVVS